ncbi:hypothetical protein E3N88_22922 [Mikania micrantha]|uniref:Protein kinase domain-containing protein n=1 Tax=Mikania micrantha TaxID=192012 RepID=A0A5N6NBU1_9ASTR|nr:hypothetical protein E3N88_22922 [Mikania micrantha]
MGVEDDARRPPLSTLMHVESYASRVDTWLILISLDSWVTPQMKLGTHLFTSTCQTKVLIAVYSQIGGGLDYIAPDYIVTRVRVTNGLETWETSVSTKIVGSFGYIAPEYMETGEDMVYWATRVVSNIKKIMDPRLEGKYPLHGASEYVALALKCVAGDPKNRPSAEEVLQSLEQIYVLN